MISHFLVVLYSFSFSAAVPVIYEKVIPGAIFRVGRAPNVRFGFGSGFSSNIGGIDHSTGIGASFQSGDPTPYGAGLDSNDGNTFARSVGYTHSPRYYPIDNGLRSSATLYENGFGRYSTAVASARNFGEFGSAVSSAHSHNGYGSAVAKVSGRGSAVSSVNGLGRYHAAVSSGLGYDSAVASVSDGSAVSQSVQPIRNIRTYNDGFGSTLSVGQGSGFSDYGTSVAASHNFPGYRASVAHSGPQEGGSYKLSEASSINAPDIQSAQSRSVQTGFNSY